MVSIQVVCFSVKFINTFLTLAFLVEFIMYFLRHIGWINDLDQLLKNREISLIKVNTAPNVPPYIIPQQKYGIHYNW